MARTTRLAATLAAATLAVHELRYLLAFGERTPDEMAHQGHGYLLVIVPVVAVAMAAVLAFLLRRLGSGGTPSAEQRSSFFRLTLLGAASIFAIYAAQELLEGLLAAGHPDGLSAIFGAGGWMAVPLALPAGAGIALIARAASPPCAHTLRLALPGARRTADRVVTPPAVAPRRWPPLACGLAERAPPPLAA